MRVLVKVNSGPHRPLIPQLAPPGREPRDSQPRDPRTGSPPLVARGATGSSGGLEREGAPSLWGRWGLGRGAETLVLALSHKASEPHPGSHLATLEGHALCVNAWRSWRALHFPCFGTAWFRALSAEPEHLSELTCSTTDYDPEQVT